MRIVGILLAAGAGTRFGGAKLLAPLNGIGIGRRSCANLIAATIEVIAVVRPGDDVLAAELVAAGARVSVCADASQGMGVSLAHGIGEAGDADAVVVALADMPWIAADTYRSVVAQLRDGNSIVVPRYDGRRGHPVGFGHGYFAALARLTGDAGARAVIGEATDITWLEVDDPGIIRDVDTRSDLPG